jgi:hypothetical protein
MFFDDLLLHNNSKASGLKQQQPFYTVTPDSTGWLGSARWLLFKVCYTVATRGSCGWNRLDLGTVLWSAFI